MTSNFSGVPDWDLDGLLPPNDVDDPTSELRSPYEISLLDLIANFGNTEHRRRLLRGLLDYRAELHQAGLTRGFQWVNGSFVENVGTHVPADIDVVTFFHIPDGHTGDTLIESFAGLFDQSHLKISYSIDAYFVPLNQTTPEEIIDASIYWYSMWSHTRSGQWKGYLKINLADDDEEAGLRLDQIQGNEGGRA